LGWSFRRCSAIDAFIFLGDETLHDIPQPSISHFN
jgi:hypothetical protein